MTISELSRGILQRGIDDWIQWLEVVNVVQTMFPGATPDEVREHSIRAIGELRDGGYVRVGDLTPDGFTSWTGDTSDILRRIDAEWRALRRWTLGDIGWLENTPIGNRIGIAEWLKWNRQKEESGRG
jgi:hypothetical protein